VQITPLISRATGSLLETNLQKTTVFITTYFPLANVTEKVVILRIAQSTEICKKALADYLYSIEPTGIDFTRRECTLGLNITGSLIHAV
jgi:hypothetical protein